MIHIRVSSGNYVFIMQLEQEKSPLTCQWFLDRLPYKTHMSQGRWSGKAVFARLGTTAAKIAYESATSFPHPGDVVMYPGDGLRGGGEIYMPYGPNMFSCEYGRIAGNHFLSIVKGAEQLAAFGELAHWHGAQEMLFERMD